MKKFEYKKGLFIVFCLTYVFPAMLICLVMIAASMIIFDDNVFVFSWYPSSYYSNASLGIHFLLILLLYLIIFIARFIIVKKLLASIKNAAKFVGSNDIGQIDVKNIRLHIFLQYIYPLPLVLYSFNQFATFLLLFTIFAINLRILLESSKYIKESVFFYLPLSGKYKIFKENISEKDTVLYIEKV